MDKKQANILLISDQIFEYNVLMDAGYKNVIRFGSMIRAYEYFRDHKEDLDKFDVVLMGSSAVGHRNCHKYNGDIMNYLYSVDIPYMSFFSSLYEEDEAKKLFYISYPGITSLGIDLTRFLSVLNDIIPSELREEIIEIPEVVEKKKIMPERREDVKVLFMGHYINEELVEKFFKDEGFTNYTFIKANNFSLERNLELFPKFDLVVADQEFNGAISLMGNEYNDYQKDKDNNTYISVYELGKTSIKKNHIRGFGTNDPSNEQKMNFDSMENEDGALLDVLRCVLKLYATYNPNLSGDEYPEEEELQNKYEEQYEQRRLEAEAIDRKFMAVRELYNRLFDCRALFKKGIKVPNVEGLKVDLLEDGMSIAFMVGPREAVRVTFHDEDCKRSDDGKLSFYLEYLSNNGKMKDAGKHMVCCSYCVPNVTDITEEEAKKIEALAQRVVERLLPVIRELENIREKAEKSSNRNPIKNKKRREYMI